MKKNSHLVYSTKTGRIKSNAKNPSVTKESGGIVRIFRESRKGSGVSIIKGLPAETDLKALAKALKKKMGVGGTIKDQTLEIQSDQREKIQILLQEQGHNVKISGG